MGVFLRLAACAFLSVACLSPAAMADICRAPKAPPLVNVIAVLPQPEETHSPSYHDLTKEMGAKLKPSYDAMGVSHSDLGFTFVVNTTWVAYRGHRCHYLTSVDLRFGYSQRRVELARELPEGSCMYQEVRAHEYRHVAVDDGIVRNNLGYVKEQLELALGGLGPVDTDNSDEALNGFKKAVRAALKPISQHVFALQDAAQERVDTESEYARVENACRMHLDPAVATVPDKPPAPPMAKDGK